MPGQPDTGCTRLVGTSHQKGVHYAQACSFKAALSRSAHQRVTQTVDNKIHTTERTSTGLEPLTARLTAAL
jgi:hypothetical protein